MATNQILLGDCLETAAKKWMDKPAYRSGKQTPEERQAQTMENIRKGLGLDAGGGQ
jgi:hypothetical protein